MVKNNGVNYMVFPDDDEGKEEMFKMINRKQVIKPEDFIFLQFAFLMTTLTDKGERLVVITESENKKRLEERMLFTGQKEKTQKEMLGEFFTPMINKIELFQTEVLEGEINNGIA